MKIKFNETLMDKYTDAYYYKGTIHEFTEERGNEILNSGRNVSLYIEAIEWEDDEPVEDVGVAFKATLTEEDRKENNLPEDAVSIELVELETLTVAQLKACAKDFGLKTTGTKAQLIERIMAFQMAQN